MSETEALLQAEPDDPFFLELKGQILLESGKPAEAIAPLREAVQRSDNQPLIAAMLGHALISTEKAENFAEAKQVLKAAVNRDNENPFAWYQLGIIYDREGDQARAALATAERSNLEGNPKLRAGQRGNGPEGHSAGHARLSSGAGHRHGFAHRTEKRQERQEGAARTVSEGKIGAAAGDCGGRDRRGV